MYEVQVYESPIGEFMGPIFCKSIYSSSSDDNYQNNSKVKLLLSFVYDGSLNKITGVAPGIDGMILGNITEEDYLGLRTLQHPMSSRDYNTRFINRRTMTGLTIDNSGNVNISTTSNMSTSYNVKGYGVNKDSKKDLAQNYHRVVNNAGPFNLSREHFGLYNGDGQFEEQVNSSLAMLNPVVYRRYVTDSIDLTNWVSTCEGAYAPFLGPNNTDMGFNFIKSPLFYKAINNNNTRFTTEIGDVKSPDFLSLRLDNVIKNERYLPISPNTTTAVMGNLFKFSVKNITGDMELLAGNAGIPSSNLAGVKISTAQGYLNIQASKGTIITTGDGEDSLNSIKVPTIGAIEINNATGVNVNGNPLMHKSFLDWFMQWFPTMFVSPMGPCTPNPAAQVALTVQSKLPSLSGGFTTQGVPTPMTGIIFDEDVYMTI